MKKLPILISLLALITLPRLCVADSSDEKIGNWAIVYDKINPDDTSAGSHEAFLEKQKYDRRLFDDGKVFSAGIFKPDNKPNQWILFLQPMRKSNATAIMNGDPTIKKGFTKGEVKIFVTYLPIINTTTTRLERAK